MTGNPFRTWRLALLSLTLAFSSAGRAATETVHVAGQIPLHLRGDSTAAANGTPVPVWAIDLKQLLSDLRTATIKSTPERPQIADAVRKALQEEVTKRLARKESVTLPPFVIFPTPANVDGSLVFASLLRLRQGDDGACDGAQTDLPQLPATSL